MRVMRILYLLFSLCILSVAAIAQEELLPLQIDGDLNNFYRQNEASILKSSIKDEAIFLPFFDDFNQFSYSPNPDLWIGNDVFVNKRYQLFPASLGVATFDALDGQGFMHSNASQFAFGADTLTSQPIRLDSIKDPSLRPLLISDSIYFSFYYQPQGKGNAPEKQDELILEFFSPTLDNWFQEWSSEGMRLDTFLKMNDSVHMKQVMIAVTDSAKYFHSGFQFRFSNKASMSSSNLPDWQANCDHWNIDFVRLDKDRTILDGSSRQIVFVNEPPVMIKRYKAMPYRQYRNDPTNSMKRNIDSIFISNLDNEGYISVYSYHISDQTNQDSLYDGGSATINPFTESGYASEMNFKYPRVIGYFSIYPEVQKTYTITHIVNDFGLTGLGDTAYRQQTFSNYYAYDDGTPEAGYGLSVNNSRAALQFQLNTKDTLTRIQMYFNRTFSSANENFFYLLVYKSLDPEELLYKKRFKVTFSEGLYNFHTFDLDTNIVLTNEFYIGFEQITSDNLNIGFDFSFDSKEYLYYNIGTGWNSSLFNGSLLMRPEFGVNKLTNVNTIKPEGEVFNFYPNPIHSGILKLDYSAFDKSGVLIEFYNLTGQLIFQQRYTTQIDISFLNRGLYLVRLIDKIKGQGISKKLIIQ
jgi:hypothetical protein